MNTLFIKNIKTYYNYRCVTKYYWVGIYTDFQVKKESNRL